MESPTKQNMVYMHLRHSPWKYITRYTDMTAGHSKISPEYWMHSCVCSDEVHHSVHYQGYRYVNLCIYL